MQSKRKMTQDEFSKMFPSLEGFDLRKSLKLDIDYKIFMERNIQENCLDKQKVIDAIKKYNDVGCSMFDLDKFEKELGI